MADIIRVADATKVIRGRTVLDHVTFDLERGGVYGSSASTARARACSSGQSLVLSI